MRIFNDLQIRMNKLENMITSAMVAVMQSSSKANRAVAIYTAI